MGDMYSGWDGNLPDPKEPQGLQIIRADREEWDNGAMIYTRVILECPKCGLRCEWDDISRNPLGMKRTNVPDPTTIDHRHISWVTASALDEWTQAQGYKPPAQAQAPASRRNPDTTKPPDDRDHNWEWRQTPEAFEEFISKMKGLEDL